MIETPRLLIRKFELTDDEFIYQLVNTSAWIENIGDKKVRSLQDAANYIKTGPLASYRENGYGAWLVELKSANAPIGLCGFFKRDYLDSADIGYALLPDFWGNGYALEAAEACMEFAKMEYDLYRLYGICNPKNKASVRLLQKLGLGFVKNFMDDDKEIALYKKENQ